MIELQGNKLDALIIASLYQNISREAETFLNTDVSRINDNPKVKRKILSISNKKYNASWISTLRLTAVACLVIISIVFTACMCIPEVRKSMWDALVSWYDDHILVYFVEENPNETDNVEVNSDGLPIIIPDNIEKKAIAVYLPEGYYAEENESLALYVDTFYYDAEGNMKFRLLQRVIDEEADSDVMIDNENDPVTTIYVNGNEGILVEYPDVPGLYYLVWQDPYYQYSLYGSFASISELIKVAEGITTE